MKPETRRPPAFSRGSPNLLAGVNDVNDIVDGDAGLCDVGGQDHLKHENRVKQLEVNSCVKVKGF